MPGELQGAAEHSHAELAALFNRAFEGYVGGSVAFDAARLASLVARQGIDLGLSRVLLADGSPAAFGLVARRGSSARLAAMGTVREARGRGLAGRLLGVLLAEAEGRGERRYLLEVLEQNPPAVALYRKHGFGTLGRLVGFEGFDPPGTPAERGAGLEPTLESLPDPAEVARLVAQHGDPDLPWQLDGFGLLGLTPPTLGVRCGPSYALLSDPRGPQLQLHALLTLPGERRRGHARRLLAALFAAHRGKHWVVPAICPEVYAPLLEGAGLRRSPLSQFLMARSLG